MPVLAVEGKLCLQRTVNNRRPLVITLGNKAKQIRMPRIMRQLNAVDVFEHQQEYILKPVIIGMQSGGSRKKLYVIRVLQGTFFYKNMNFAQILINLLNLALYLHCQ